MASISFLLNLKKKSFKDFWAFLLKNFWAVRKMDQMVFLTFFHEF